MSLRGYQTKMLRIHSSAFVDETALVVGDVPIGADSSVWPMCTVHGDVMPVRIGDRTNIQDSSVLHVTSDSRFAPGGFALEVGSGVTVGHGACLHACIVEDDSLIGIRAVVLDGAIIPKRVIVGANSLVPPGRHLESGFLWVEFAGQESEVAEATANWNFWGFQQRTMSN